MWFWVRSRYTVDWASVFKCSFQLLNCFVSGIMETNFVFWFISYCVQTVKRIYSISFHSAIFNPLQDENLNVLFSTYPKLVLSLLVHVGEIIPGVIQVITTIRCGVLMPLWSIKQSLSKYKRILYTFRSINSKVFEAKENEPEANQIFILRK